MPPPPRRVGILGLGAIGRPVARALAAGMPGVTLVGAASRDAGRAREFLAGLPGSPPLLGFGDLLDRADVVVEAATQAALVELAPSILEAGRDLVVLSVGALLDHPEWVERAAARGGRIHAPSAAIAGLDGLKGAAVDGHLDTVVMETRKPPRGPGRSAGRRGDRPRRDHGADARVRGHGPRGVSRLPRQRQRGGGGVPGRDRPGPHLYPDPRRSVRRPEPPHGDRGGRRSGGSGSRSRTCPPRTPGPASSRICRRSPISGTWAHRSASGRERRRRDRSLARESMNDELIRA